MRSSTTLLYLSLFLVVAGFYAVLNPGEVSSPWLASRSMQLLPLEGDDTVDWIEIQNAKRKETITLAREGERWMMKHPVSYPADPILSSGFVTALTLSTKARRLVPEGDWGEYGLKDPSIKVGVRTSKTKERRYLYLGSPTPVGPFVFARWEGEKEHFLLDANLKRAFDRSVYSLREKQIFRTPMEEVSKMEVGTGAKRYLLSKQEKGWQWEEPSALSGKSLSKDRADELLLFLRDLFVKEFLDEEKRKPEELGGEAQGASVRLEGASGASETVHFGREVPSRDAFTGMRAGEDAVFLVARGNIRMFFETFETLGEEARG